MTRSPPAPAVRPGRGLSLRWALLAYVVVPLALALALAAYQSLRAVEDWIERRQQAEVALVARTLQLPLSRAIERLDREVLDDALEAAFRLNRVFGVYLYDPAGRPVAAAGAVEPGRLDAELLALVRRGAARGGYDQLADEAVYSYFVPLQDTAGAMLGVLRVTSRASDFNDNSGELRLKAALILALAVAIMAGLVLWGHHLAIGGPLGRLVEDMARVGAGERSHRTAPGGPREVAALGLALNRMLDSIDAAEAELDRRHRVQADLERRLRHAETMASLGRLAGGVAHELGTPLGIVDGKAQRLLRRADCPTELAESLQDIRTQVRRMECIVRQLLDFGRGGSERRRSLSAARLGELAAEAVQEPFQAAGVRLELAGDDPSPWVSADPMRLNQALANLLQNAAQASPGGRVRLSWRAGGRWVELRVEDDGPGVDPALAERIFEPFFTTKPVGRGSGLGLAIVHSVAGEHGGTVTVGRSPLGGAAFTLRLPRTTEPRQASEADDRSSQ